MSRRKRPRTTIGETPASGAAVRVLALSNYDAANPSPVRGYVQWGTLDSSREMDRGTRLKLIRLSRWLYANVGLAKRCVDGLADLVGYLTPQAATADRAWNEAAERLFRDQTNAQIFDRAGKLSFRAWQRALTQLRVKDGDSLTVLTRTSSGIGRVAIYESHQVDDGQGAKAETRDGVYVDAAGRNAAYRVVDAADPTVWRKIDAGDAIFYAAFDRPSQVRGVPGLAHAANNLIDRTEINRDWKHAIKTAAQLGLVLTKDNAAAARPARGLAASLVKTDDLAGTNLLTESVYQGGQVPHLEPGEKIDVVQDTRPHPNALDLQEQLVRDIAWGCGVAPEVLWDAAGLTGPGTRFVMALTRRWVSGEQERLRDACQRVWIHWVAHAVARGDLGWPKDDRWWACDWIPQADPTIDIGREGALALNQLALGATTLADIYAGAGADWETKLAQRHREITRARELAEEGGYPLSLLIGSGGTPAAAPPAVDTTTTEQEQTQENEEEQPTQPGAGRSRRRPSASRRADR